MNILFYFVIFLHILYVAGFNMFGLLIIPINQWRMYIYISLLISLHWMFFNNQCLLSIWENKLKKHDNPDSTRIFPWFANLFGTNELVMRTIYNSILFFNIFLVTYIYRADKHIILSTILCILSHIYSTLICKEKRQSNLRNKKNTK